MKYALQTVFSFLSGIILLAVNAVGDPGVYAQIVNYLKNYGYVPESYANLALNVLYGIAFLGGASVLIGGFAYYFDRVRPARFFVSVGAGVSITILALRAIDLGPRLKAYILAGNLSGFARALLGLGVGLRLLGTLFALFALFDYYVPLILGSIAAVAYLAAGATISIHAPIESLSLVGVAIFLVGLVGAAGAIRLYRILGALVLLAFLPSFFLRLFGGFFDAKTLALSLVGIAVNVLMISRKRERITFLLSRT